MVRSLRAISSFQRPLNQAEERVISLLHHLRGAKSKWEAKVAAEGATRELQERIEDLETQIKALTESSALHPLSFTQAFNQSKSTLIAGAAFACLAAGAITGSNQNSKDAAPLFYLLGSGSALAAAVRTGQSIRRSREEAAQSSDRLSMLRDELSQSRSSYSEEAKILRSNNIDLPQITIGKALIPIDTVEILGKPFLISREKLIKPTKLKSIGLRDLTNESQEIIDLTSRLNLIPVLLQPDEDSISESRESNSALHGEERSLKEAVGRYVNTLASIGDEELELSAILPQTSLGKALAMAASDNETVGIETDMSSISFALSDTSSDIDEELKKFEQLHETTEAASKTAIPQLARINDELKALCNRYRVARTTSTNELHLNYQNILRRANWASKQFYCPRTILSKDYLQALIGLDLEEAHNLTAEELVSSLQSDHSINDRLNSKPQLVDDLLKSHSAVQELIQSYGLNVDNRGVARAGSAAEHIIDQLKQEISLFRQRLIESLTGSPNGFLGISESARLYYDPIRDTWSSPVLPYSYTSSEAEQYGQLMRTDVDLLLPLWEHLWTEKADFRKSELFRTNENIQRMSEKEGEKIKQIGYQFQSDLREVRSNMFLAKADFDAKIQELAEYEDSVKELGLMDENQLQKLQAATSELAAVSGETSGDAEGYELILMQEPTNQLLLRQSGVHDPIDVIKSPDLLIEGGQDKGIRRLTYRASEEVEE